MFLSAIDPGEVFPDVLQRVCCIFNGFCATVDVFDGTVREFNDLCSSSFFIKLRYSFNSFIMPSKVSKRGGGLGMLVLI